MAKVIYLEYDEEILSALGKIRKTGEADVVLVAPKDARIFHNLTGLKLLKHETEKSEKQLSVATADERGKMLLSRAGIKLAPNVPTAAGGSLVGEAKPLLRRQGMGDIMMRPVKPLTAGKKSSSSKPVPVEELEELIGPTVTGVEIKIPEPVKLPKIPYRYTVLPAAVVALTIAFMAVFVLPSAKVSIIPRTEPITRDLEMQVDSHVSVPDVQSLTIPGRLVTKEISLAKNYPTTGIKNVGEKASGFVTLYNFSKTTLILRSSTTRLEVDGKSYYFLQDVGSIRPTARIGSDLEIDQSSLIEPVPVVAKDAGESFNLTAGTRFEIYNEVFGHQPEVLYAVNANPVSGGTNKQIKIVAAPDIDSARKDLSSGIADELRSRVKEEAIPDSVLADNAFSIQVIEEKTSRPVNAEAEAFELSQKVKVTALVYSKTDVSDMIIERIVRLLPDNKFLLPEKQQTLSAQFMPPLDLTNGVGTLRAHFESAVRYKIETDFLSRSLPGKTATQVKEILLSRPEISDVEVSFSPFWVKSVPRFGSKVVFKIAQ